MSKWKCRSREVYLTLLIGVALLSLGVSVSSFGSEQLTLTLYQNGPAVVVQREEVGFGEGTSELTRWIPANAVSSTVFVDSPGRDLRAATIEPQIGSESELLESLIGEKVEVFLKDPDGDRVAGELVDVLNGNLLLEVSDGETRLIRNPTGYAFAGTQPEGRGKRLEVEFRSGAGSQAGPVTFGYQVQGLNWEPKYVGFLNEEAKELRFRGIAHLSNDTGWNYSGAEVDLLAGSPKREVEQPKLFAMRNATEGGETDQEKVFEYYRYAVSFPVDLEVGTELRVPFIPERKVDYRSYYEFEPAVAPGVRTFVVIENEDDKGLGVPLAAGTVRIYQDSRERTLLGEDKLPNLPEGEESELELGKSFDLEGERKVLEHHKLDEDSWRDRVQLKLTNRKDDPVKIRVLERLPGSWDVTRSSHRYENYDSRRILFEVEVKEKSSLEIDYTVKYKY